MRVRTVYRGGSVWQKGAAVQADIAVCDGFVESVGQAPALDGDIVVPAEGCIWFPGFADVHVHLRQPGFSYKETVAAATAAAARGGFTSVCAMPNLNPAPDSEPALQVPLSILQRDACVDARAYGTMTVGRKGARMSDMAGMAAHVVGFSDDGSGVNDEALLMEIMREAKRLGKPIAAHSEDLSRIAPGGCVHDGRYARENGLPGIPSESEWKPVERDLRLALATGCAWHVCHVSTKESVALVRRAKALGADVTCETAPHYLLLDEDDLRDEGCFKMNPPIRSREDRQALIEGLCDGTIDIIATDHAPHAANEKDKGLRGSAMGVVGLETAFPMLYTHLVAKGLAPLSRVVDALTRAPRERFALGGSEIIPGAEANFTAFDMRVSGVVRPEGFLSLGRATPFAGWEYQGDIVATVYKGKTVYGNKKTEE